MSLPSNQLSNIKFNNCVVSKRGVVKQVVVRTCHRMTREIAKFKNCKSESEEVKNKKKKKASRLAKEIKIIKKLNKDDILKFALQFDKKADVILNDTKANAKLKVLVKLTENKLLKEEVIRFRQKYPNWKIEIPNIIHNIELKKKGMKLNETIAKGEADRMKKLDKYPTADMETFAFNETKTPSSGDNTKKTANKNKSKKLTKNTKIKGSIDSLNSWTVESKEKFKFGKQKQEKTASSASEIKQEIEDNEMNVSGDEVEENEENDELALKLSNALKRIAPGSDEEEEEEEEDDDDDDDEEEEEEEEESSEDEFEEERRKRKLELIKQSRHKNLKSNSKISIKDEISEESGTIFTEKRKKIKLESMKQSAKKMESKLQLNAERSEESESSEDEQDEDEFEQERWKRKVELVKHGTRKINKEESSDESEGSEEDPNEDERRKRSLYLAKQNGEINKRDSKHIVRIASQTQNKSYLSENKISKNQKLDLANGFSKKNEKKTTKPPKESVRVPKPVEKVVDDFFMTKDNREYLSSVKPNAVPEPSEETEYKPKPQFVDATPKEIYRKGKKLVLNKNRGNCFGDKKGNFRDNKPFRKFDSEKSDRFGGKSDNRSNFHDSKSSRKFNSEKSQRFGNKFAGGSGSFQKRSEGFSGNDRGFGRDFDPAPPQGGTSGEKLHPSWEAKKRHQPAITHFKGKKIKFDE